MRDKLSIKRLEMINKEFNDTLNEMQRKYTDAHEFEEKVSVLYKLYMQNLLSFNLSDIPFEMSDYLIDSEIINMYDFSNTHANIDFKVFHIDYNAKYNFKGCNIRNIEELDTKFLIRNKESFDDNVVNQYSYLFALSTIEVGYIKINYINNEEGKNKVQELSKYLEDKIDLFYDISEINILNSSFNYNDGIVDVNIKSNVIDSFVNYLRTISDYYRELFFLINNFKEKEGYDLNCFKANILCDFNRYFKDRNHKVYDMYIMKYLYYQKDYKMLSDYLKNKNIEQVIDKHFEPLFNEIVNYYFDNISDNMLLQNKDLLSDLIYNFDLNLFLNNSIDDEQSKFDDEISDETIISILRDILKIIDQTGNLLELFDKKLNGKRIIFYKDKSDYPEYFKNDNEKINQSYYDPKEDVILCYDENSYNTVVTLVHEFIHMYSHSKGEDGNNAYFQEVPSIFFENIAKNYLSNTFLIDKDKFKITSRRKIINNFNSMWFNTLRNKLELLNTKRNRDLKFDDFYVHIDDGADDVTKELFNIFNFDNNSNKDDKYANHKEAFDNIDYIISAIFTNNFDLTTYDEKVNFSYILGTKISEICAKDDKYINLFLFIAQNIYNNAYDSNDLLQMIIKTVNSFENEESLEQKTK